MDSRLRGNDKVDIELNENPVNQKGYPPIYDISIFSSFTVFSERISE
jgi:hypothetical protein